MAVFGMYASTCKGGVRVIIYPESLPTRPVVPFFNKDPCILARIRVKTRSIDEMWAQFHQKGDYVRHKGPIIDIPAGTAVVVT